jgi:hypothetical protein
MAVGNLNLKDDFVAPRTDIKASLSFDSMSPLGKKLYKIAREIELSEESALSEHEIREELRLRRGGRQPED